MARLPARARIEADQHYTRAVTALGREQYDEAIGHIAQALEAMPTHPAYLATRGLAQLGKKRWDEARAAFTEAHQQHPGDMVALYGLGVLAYNERAWNDAELYFTRAWGVAPRHGELPYYLALVAHRRQDNPLALAHMREALGLLEAANDRRREDARRWIAEFERLVREAEAQQRHTQITARLGAGAAALGPGTDDAD